MIIDQFADRIRLRIATLKFKRELGNIIYNKLIKPLNRYLK